MSERRTAEVKLRITPTEKAEWQAAAEERGVGLSGFIRSSVNLRAQIKVLDPVEVKRRAAQALALTTLQSPPEDWYKGVATHEGDGRFSYPPLPARDSSCPHGKPPWAWCGECRG